MTTALGADMSDNLSMVCFALSSCTMPTSALKTMRIKNPKLPTMVRNFSLESMKKQISTANTMKIKLKNVKIFSRRI